MRFLAARLLFLSRKQQGLFLLLSRRRETLLGEFFSHFGKFDRLVATLTLLKKAERSEARSAKFCAKNISNYEILAYAQNLNRLKTMRRRLKIKFMIF